MPTWKQSGFHNICLVLMKSGDTNPNSLKSGDTCRSSFKLRLVSPEFPASLKAKTRALRRCFIQELPSLLKADKSESGRSRLYRWVKSSYSDFTIGRRMQVGRKSPQSSLVLFQGEDQYTETLSGSYGDPGLREGWRPGPAFSHLLQRRVHALRKQNENRGGLSGRSIWQIYPIVYNYRKHETNIWTSCWYLQNTG
jgi:hypothetical protein